MPTGAAAQVCLPPLHAAFGGGGGAAAAQDTLLVDGHKAAAASWGRLLCAAADLAPGTHLVSRIAGR